MLDTCYGRSSNSAKFNKKGPIRYITNQKAASNLVYDMWRSADNVKSAQINSKLPTIYLLFTNQNMLWIDV